MSKTIEISIIFLVGLLVSSLSSTISAQEIEADFYGELNVSYDFNDPSDDDWTSYVSRLGLKGKYAFSESLAIVYQVEQEVDVAHGGTNRDSLLSTRNSFVGLSTQIGKFIFGAHDTPFKRALGKVDLFNDQAGDVKNLVVGEVRAKDSWAFHSEKLNGWAVQAMLIPGDNDFGSSKSLAVTYSSNNLSLGFSVDADMRKNDRSVAKTKVYDSYRGNVHYKIGRWKLGFLLQSSELLDATEAETGYLASVSYKIGDITAMVQHGQSDIVAADLASTNVGLHYNFDKKSKVYLYYWDYDRGDHSDVLSLGIEIKF